MTGRGVLGPKLERVDPGLGTGVGGPTAIELDVGTLRSEGIGTAGASIGEGAGDGLGEGLLTEAAVSELRREGRRDTEFKSSSCSTGRRRLDAEGEREMGRLVLAGVLGTLRDMVVC